VLIVKGYADQKSYLSEMSRMPSGTRGNRYALDQTNQLWMLIF
jgi:hypothetical protein